MSHITPYPHRRLITQAVQKCPPPDFNHTFWIQAAFSSQITVSQIRTLCSQTSLLLVPYSYVFFFLSFALSFTSFSPNSSLSHSHFPPSQSIFIPISHSTVGSYQWCLRKEPSVRHQAEMLSDLCSLPRSATAGAQLDQQEAIERNRGSSNAGNTRQGWPDSRFSQVFLPSWKEAGQNLEEITPRLRHTNTHIRTPETLPATQLCLQR